MTGTMVSPPLASYDADRAFGGYTLFAPSCDPPTTDQTGTIYLIDGRKQKFTMYLSGFSIDGHLFAKSSHSPK